ncbi:nuclear transport factor 2 family protein [Rhodospirillum centenum]|uniref:SnoaL-like domain-containing protein n=1 Tax=Rhodospirillum centenum (strain ATCC 51521 / SW) TaxID=414684 RepID=B6IRE4_RHOCS|nr:nuclear transport factor 2 family protein [Rhodospirillum centenum]ACI98030.1 conserved hypothetical protein [Rhodospirillum centenum SW]
MAEPVPVEAALDAYVRYFEALTPDTLDRLDRLAVPDIHFKDPFNEFRSRDRLKLVFGRMFQRVDSPRFIVRDHAISGQTAYLRWTLTFRSRGPRPWSIEGMSEVRFDHAGRAVSHVDHWDAAEQLYERLPVLGTVLRLIKARLAD